MLIVEKDTPSVLEIVQSATVQELEEHSNSKSLNVLGQILIHNATPLPTVKKIISNHPVLIPTYLSFYGANSEYVVELTKTGKVNPVDYHLTVDFVINSAKELTEETYNFFAPHIPVNPWLASSLVRNGYVTPEQKRKIAGASFYPFKVY